MVTRFIFLSSSRFLKLIFPKFIYIKIVKGKNFLKSFAETSLLFFSKIIFFVRLNYLSLFYNEYPTANKET